MKKFAVGVTCLFGLVFLVLMILFPKEKPNSQLCEVTQVTSGDSLTLNCDNQTRQLRLCGVVISGNQAEAKRVIASLAENKSVSAVFSGNTAEIFVPGSEEEKMLSEELLVKGLAKFNVQDNCPNSDTLKIAEQMAKEKLLGVWK
ncbi:thermonuclease family protein [Anabaena azotica]|uniref:Thermonuclease family protein n=1 Tax=Anabaena azotica FACHB-119 TaxID=947527 RepID=A0ABR8D2B8_9NOST|nr:thermonuclease family protein [Anabaena azotica]MBD2499883.1 thermonuclease family protein [Anabaena azotica FACHB-119]